MNNPGVILSIIFMSILIVILGLFIYINYLINLSIKEEIDRHKKTRVVTFKVKDKTGKEITTSAAIVKTEKPHAGEFK